MINKLRTNVVHDPTGIVEKLNEVIEITNQLDSREPIVEVVEWSKIQHLIDFEKYTPEVFFARRLK